VDNVYLATSFAEAVPEPSSFLLAAIGLAVFMTNRRRGRCR